MGMLDDFVTDFLLSPSDLLFLISIEKGIQYFLVLSEKWRVLEATMENSRSFWLNLF
jgi:hypothetical protein